MLPADRFGKVALHFRYLHGVCELQRCAVVEFDKQLRRAEMYLRNGIQHPRSVMERLDKRCVAVQKYGFILVQIYIKKSPSFVSEDGLIIFRFD